MATAPKVEPPIAHKFADMCLENYGNGRWNHASYCMALYIKQEHEADSVNQGYKAKLRECIGLLSSMVSCGEDHTETSRMVIKEAREALENL